MGWEIEEADTGIATVRVESARRGDWEQYFLLTSDVHFDNPHCRQDLFRRHAQQALERNAPIFSFGDFFCGMQGRSDPRGQKGDVRPENNTSDYFGSLIRSGTEFLKPYAHNMALLSRGNHEAKLQKHSEIDLTRAVADRLRDIGSPIVYGGYRGWVRIMLMGSETSRQRQQFRMYYTHGSGGSAPVTKGIIRTNRRAAYIDADIIVGGHIHEAWGMELRRAALTDQGREIISDQLHLCLPTYKEEFEGVWDGFHHEKEAAPKPIGGWWLRFYFDRHKDRFGFDYARAR